jgi:hypothetical protein
MKNSILSIFVVFMVFTMSYGWDITTDRAAVRAILDSNGLFTTPIGDACYEGSSGRVEYFYHNGDAVWKTSKTYSKLTKIPDAIGNLTGLTRFYVMNNSITHISDSMRNCKNLQMFDVSNNLLDSLPQINFRTIILDWFQIHNNLLKVLPDSIENIVQGIRDTLRLNNNRLTTIPAAIANIQCLFSLHLENNILDSIPSSIGSLPNLQWLQMDNNHLTCLPKTLGSTSVWITVIASHNLLTTIPMEMMNSMVADLEIDYNYVCTKNAAYNWLKSMGRLNDDYQNCTLIEAQPSERIAPVVYPNPFSGSTFIRTDSPIKVFDVSGRLVFQTSKSTSWSAIPGIYILENNDNIQKVVSIR